MRARVLPLVTVALAAIGCSVLVNTDFSGGTEPAASNKGGQGGDTIMEIGGTFGFGGTFGQGGVNEGGEAAAPAEGGAGDEPGTSGGSGALGGASGEGDEGGAGEPEGGTGADEGVGGSSGTGGTEPTGGAGMGGTAGTAGATNGGSDMGGTSGATAGMGATSGTGGMTCDADLTSDPMHCGSCDNACADGIACENGVCVTSPCAGLCPAATTIPKVGDGYREDNIPDTDVCFETDMYSVTAPALPSLICWNFMDRVLQVNGVTLQCKTEPGIALPPTRAAGYCVHATVSNSGDKSDGFKFPIPGQLMP